MTHIKDNHSQKQNNMDDSVIYPNFNKDDMDYLWEKSLELLENNPEITETRFRSLALRTSPISYKSNIFSLGVPSVFVQRVIEKTCLPQVINTLREVSELDNLEVIVEVDESVPSSYNVAPIPPDMLPEVNSLNSANTVSHKHTPPQQSPSELISNSVMATSPHSGKKRVSPGESASKNQKSTTVKNDAFNDVRLDSKYDFPSFVTGDSNNFAYTSALAVAETPGLSYNPLFIWGASGLGKTHLLHAIGNHIREIYPEKKVICTTAKSFVEQFVNRTALAGLNTARSLGKMNDHYRNTDLLLIDDIQDLKGEGSTNHFFHTFNYLKDRRKQIVLVADRSPEELKLDERFTSRFKSGLMVDVLPPTYEMRCAILKNFVKGMNIPFSGDAIDLIAERSSDNIRELEGAVIRSNAWATIKKKTIADVDIVEQAIDGYFPEKEARPISIPSIQKEVCAYYGINHTELIGTKRKQEIVFPRHVAMFLCAELTDSSNVQIGKSFGGKDHTTVMHAVDKIRKKMGIETETYNQIEYLTKILRTKTI